MSYKEFSLPFVMSVDTLPEISAERRKEGSKPLLIAAHAYQPPREFLMLGEDRHQRVDVAAAVNEKIYKECYEPLFVEGALEGKEPFADGTVFSMYGTLREWLKGAHPEAFEKIRENLHRKEGKEFMILGDPYLHPILPLLPEQDQDMLIKAGKESFESDFGFFPKGFWLPETAVSLKTLDILAQNGYEFVVLRDSQVKDKSKNPMWVKLPSGGEIAVVHCDSNLSGSVSFKDEVTRNAEEFLKNPEIQNKKIVSWMSDAEFYGHHMKGKDKFLAYVTSQDVLASAGMRAFDVEEALNEPRTYTEIWENSSWSCSHNLGRWTGRPECNCDGIGNPRVTEYKRSLYKTLTAQGVEINSRLDAISSDWRSQFVDFFGAVAHSMYFEGDIDEDIEKLAGSGKVDLLKDKKVQMLFKANLARLTGMTSCVWFFGKESRPEREIATANIEAVDKLLKKADTMAEKKQPALAAA